MGKILTYFVALFVVLSGFVSCNTSGCMDNQSALPLAGFYSSSTGSAVTLDSIGIAGIGAPNDSMLVIPGEAVSQVYLPLRSTEASTQYCFTYRGEGLTDNPELNDTLTFVYTSTPYFAGEECGASYRYNISRFIHTRHMIDSIALTDREVTNVDREIIKIYFRVVEPPQQPDETL